MKRYTARLSMCLAALVMGVASLTAQPLADESRNHLIFPSGLSPNYKIFFSKLDYVLSNREGKINILHIGDSHVQGGAITKSLRDHLTELQPEFDAGFGLVFPVAAGRTNNPVSYITEYTGEWTYKNSLSSELPVRLGLTGMAITCADTASVMIRTCPRGEFPRYAFNRVRVYGYPADGKAATLRLKTNKDGYLVRTGTDSTCVFRLKAPAYAISLSFPSEFTVTGIRLENDEPGITLSGIGVNGASLRSYFRCPDLQRDLNREHPDLAILAVGTNDAVGKNFDPEQFKRQYGRLIRMIRKSNPRCALLFITNNDINIKDEPNPNGPLVQQAMMELANQYGGAVWDEFAIMGGLGSMTSWRDAEYASKDCIHFTVKGYRYIGDLLYKALKEAFDNYTK